MHENPLSAVVVFLIAELKEARGRSITPSDEFNMFILDRRAARRTRRLERLAEQAAQVDAETAPVPQ